jgi:hypothetical protein
MDTVVLRHGNILNEQSFEKNGGPSCPVCDKKFSLINRKHNCRVCGIIHCATCVPKIAILESADDDLLRICRACTLKVAKAEKEEAGLEREKLRKVKEVLKAKAEGIEAKTANSSEMDGSAATQLQQKMRMQEQVQRHSVKEEVQVPAELVLEPLASDWTSKEYRVVCVPESRWLPDDSVTKCPGCSNDFTPQLRRHHCRACGKIYCSPCVPFVGLSVDAARMDAAESVRTCGPCVQTALAIRKRMKAAEGQKKARVIAEKRALEKVDASPS